MTREDAKKLSLPRRQTTLGSLIGFEHFMLPHITAMEEVRGFIEHDLIETLTSIQPMTTPSSQVFYMDLVYGDTWYKRLWRWTKHWYGSLAL